MADKQKTRPHFKRRYSKPWQGQKKGAPLPAPKIKAEADPRLARVFDEIGVPQQGSFVPDPFQLEAVEAVARFDCLVTAPTGSGKTWIAVEAAKQVVQKGGRVWYASPLKALSNAKHLEFGKIFGPENVGIVTGDRKENSDAAVVVGTTEILRNRLYDCMYEGVDLNADLVVLDEAHYLSDEQRGVVWEETIIYLPVRVPLLLLSATIGNAKDVAAWMEGIRGRPCRVVAQKKRPVGLVPLFLEPGGRLSPLVTLKSGKVGSGPDKRLVSFLKKQKAQDRGRGERPPGLGQILTVLKKFNLLPALFFLKSRRDCDIAVELCPRVLLEDPARQEKVIKALDDLTAPFPYLAGHRQRKAICQSAVAAHHSGHLPAWKLTVEILMSRGLLDAVFATSTVAAGVNFPARTVVLVNSDQFNGVDFSPLSPTQFHQMTGRAGRRGMDFIGFALAVSGPFMDLEHLAKLFDAPPDYIKSQIRIDFSLVLNLLLSHEPADIAPLLEKSLASFLQKKTRTKRRRGSGAESLWPEFERHGRFLKALDFVNDDGRLTDDGIWAAALRLDQPLLIAQGLRLGVLPQDDPALLAALVAVFVQDKEKDLEIAQSNVPKKLLSAYKKMERTLRPLVNVLTDAKFFVRPLAMWPAATIWAWATQKSWQDTLFVAGMAEGDLAMLIVRTADNLRQIRNLKPWFPEVAACAEKAVGILIRGPLLAGEAILEAGLGGEQDA